MLCKSFRKIGSSKMQKLSVHYMIEKYSKLHAMRTFNFGITSFEPGALRSIEFSFENHLELKSQVSFTLNLFRMVSIVLIVILPCCVQIFKTIRNWHKCSRRTRFREIWVWDNFRADITHPLWICMLSSDEDLKWNKYVQKYKYSAHTDPLQTAIDILQVTDMY